MQDKHIQYVQFANGTVGLKIEPNYRGLTTFEEAEKERARIREIYLRTGAVDISFNKIPKLN